MIKDSNVMLAKTNMTLGEKIRILRIKADLTQPELAKKLNIEQSYVSKLENDIHIPSEEILDRLARVFAQTTEQLLYGIDQQIIHKSFQHIPKLLDKMISYEAFLSRYFKRWLITHICFIVTGIILFLFANFNVVLPNEVYNYRSQFTYTYGTPECLKRHYAIQPNAIKKNGLTKFHCGMRTRWLTFFTYSYLGNTFKKNVDGEIKHYELYKTMQISRWANRLLSALGLLLIGIGGVCLLLEKRIHKTE